MNIQLQAKTSEDDEFLYQVYCTTRAFEMAMVPWTEEQRESFLRTQFNAQQLDYGKRYADAQQTIIVADDIKVGRLHVVELESDIKILDVTVLPEHRQKGIGTSIFKDLFTKARGSGKRLLIYVETFNPSVSFFEKRGFNKIEEDGVYFLFEWRANSQKENDGASS